MWPKFGNFSISMREVIITSILQGFDPETIFLRSDLDPSSIIRDWQTKSQKVLGNNSYICKSFRGKTGRGAFLAPLPILNRVKGYLRYKTTIPQNVSSEAQLKNFFIS